MLIENVKKVERIWKSEGLNIAEPLSKNAVIESFAELNKRLSKDVIEVYSNLGGMADDDVDSICFTFWTVKKIIAENELSNELTFFADFLIYSHLYGFKFENEDISSVHIYWGKNQIEKVADSFDEFFDNYLTKSEKYFLFGRED